MKTAAGYLLRRCFTARTSQLGWGMRAIEPSRWDDLILAGLLLVIGVPRAVFALFYDRPVGPEGALSMVCVVLALLILFRRNTRTNKPAQRGG